ncbi:MAG: glycosyltransferase family 39 protein [Elusimicrobia bacterium]|nr:glycosyltransferase family 39 protein [Elusimicrobiota bacterium]
MKGTAAVPAWLLAAALALPLFVLGAPLIEIDDARYAEVPRAMAASGDWILPSLNAMPYVEKPPLWYWLGAASIKLLGAGEAAARLPMLLLALLGAGGVYWLGSWLYSPNIGRTAALATATAGLWLFLVHNLTLDLPVSVFLLWTTALILRVLEKPADAGWAAPAAWAAAALAFLSKGLISFLFPVLWTAVLVGLFPKWRRPALKLFSPPGVVLAAVVAAPWFFAVQARRPDFLHTFFIEQHFQRYLTPKYSRGAPWWFYLAVVPAGLLPWTAPFLSGLAKTVRSPFSDARATALALWVIGVVAFFTTSSSKLATYALPVVPHAALLAALSLEDGPPKWAWRLCRGAGALLLLCAAVAALLHFRLPHLSLPPTGADAPLLQRLAVLAAATLAALGAAQAYAPSARRPAFALGLGGTAAGLLALALVSAASPLISARALALSVKESARPEDEVWTYDSYLHGLQFYTGRPVDKMVYFVGEFHYARRDEANAQRFGDDDEVRALPRREGRTFVAMKTGRRAHFETMPAKGSISSWREFGPWSLAEIRARGPR